MSNTSPVKQTRVRNALVVYVSVCVRGSRLFLSFPVLPCKLISFLPIDVSQKVVVVVASAIAADIFAFSFFSFLPACVRACVSHLASVFYEFSLSLWNERG